MDRACHLHLSLYPKGLWLRKLLPFVVCPGTKHRPHQHLPFPDSICATEERETEKSFPRALRGDRVPPPHMRPQDVFLGPTTTSKLTTRPPCSSPAALLSTSEHRGSFLTRVRDRRTHGARRKCSLDPCQVQRFLHCSWTATRRKSKYKQRFT